MSRFNITVFDVSPLEVQPKHVSGGGEVMVVCGRGSGGMLFWMSPETAAQWIKALEPVAAGEHTTPTASSKLNED